MHHHIDWDRVANVIGYTVIWILLPVAALIAITCGILWALVPRTKE